MPQNIFKKQNKTASVTDVFIEKETLPATVCPVSCLKGAGSFNVLLTEMWEERREHEAAGLFHVPPLEFTCLKKTPAYRCFSTFWTSRNFFPDTIAPRNNRLVRTCFAVLSKWFILPQTLIFNTGEAIQTVKLSGSTIKGWKSFNGN